MRRLLAFSLASFSTLVAAGCAAPDDGPTAVLAPALGKADGSDSADHQCTIVLRSAARPVGRGTATDCDASGTCWLVWEGTLDVATSAIAGGDTPAVLLQSGSDPTWWEFPATATTGAPAGFTRYGVHLGRHTVLAKASLTGARLALAPLLHTPGGGRIFDHNRNPGPFDNYILDGSDNFSVGLAPAICVAPAPGHATLNFDAGWRQTQRGALIAGGQLTVAYDLNRMPQCFGSTYNGLPAWQTLAYLRFLPGGQLAQGGMRGTQDASFHWQSVPYTASIPAGTTEVDLWFETSGDYCSTTWDSNYGANYRFAVDASAPAAVTWAGNWGGDFNRDCQHNNGLADPVTVTSWTLQRACMFVDAEVYVPGLTDGAAEHPEKILVQVEASVDGGARTTSWLDYAGRSGNNYRYKWTLDSFRTITWSKINYTFRFSTDGNIWYRIGQDNVPGGGNGRTIVYQKN